ncbi:cytochrome P450 6a8-like [Bacillus rossius redtenbacheri]|uniref:cytochrome P450 6a8-like n=1 Tax=Bacillus rossius redtenbacheri TaxID=93214 RepID=UPI002FDE2AC0
MTWWLLLQVAALLAAVVFSYLWYSFTYWKRRGMPYVTMHFPMGIVWDVICQRKSFAEAYEGPYKLSDQPVVGFFELHKPVLMIRDPNLIKEILIREFPSFHDRGLFIDEKVDPLSANLFFLKGARWRDLRAKLTPTFSSGKTRAMLPAVAACGAELCALLRASPGGVAEVQDAAARFTTDVIATCAFGVQGRSLAEPDSEFRRWGRKCFEPSAEVVLRNVLAFVLPAACSLLRVRTTPSGVTGFFRRLVAEAAAPRRSGAVRRADFLQLLVQLEGAAGAPGLTDDEIMAQVFIFFLAGFETSSTAITFCLYELALNGDVQDRLRSEVEATLGAHGGRLTHEAVQSMEYLDMVVSETLRKYPPLAFLNRECTRTYRMPGTSWHVEPGTSVVVSLLGLHRDPAHFPDPLRFDPERFSEQQRGRRPSCVYMPFGEGPRACVGMRFGLMQVKVGLILLLESFVFRPCERTSQPMVFDPKSFFLAPSSGMWLHLTPAK